MVHGYNAFNKGFNKHECVLVWKCFLELHSAFCNLDQLFSLKRRIKFDRRVATPFPTPFPNTEYLRLSLGNAPGGMCERRISERHSSTWDTAAWEAQQCERHSSAWDATAWDAQCRVVYETQQYERHNDILGTAVRETQQCVRHNSARGTALHETQ